MKTKIITVIMLIAISSLLCLNNVFAAENNIKDSSELIKEAFENWIDSDDYQLNSLIITDEEGNEVKGYLTYKESSDDNQKICFVELKNESGEYKTDYIGETPKNYDKFLEKFNEYESTETYQVQGKESDKTLASQEEKKISNTIIVSCSIVLALIVLAIIIRFAKKACNFRKNV